MRRTSGETRINCAGWGVEGEIEARLFRAFVGRFKGGRSFPCQRFRAPTPACKGSVDLMRGPAPAAIIGLDDQAPEAEFALHRRHWRATPFRPAMKWPTNVLAVVDIAPGLDAATASMATTLIVLDRQHGRRRGFAQSPTVVTNSTLQRPSCDASGRAAAKAEDRMSRSAAREFAARTEWPPWAGAGSGHYASLA